VEYCGNEPVQTLLPDRLEGYSLTGTGDFPRIATEDIKDQSKGDVITKGLVVLQTGWFIVHCIARGSHGLPITTRARRSRLQASTSCWLWWDKPLHVQRAVRVYKKRDPGRPSMDGQPAWSLTISNLRCAGCSLEHRNSSILASTRIWYSRTNARKSGHEAYLEVGTIVRHVWMESSPER
jgi:hypothetical protein